MDFKQGSHRYQPRAVPNCDCDFPLIYTLNLYLVINALGLKEWIASSTM